MGLKRNDGGGGGGGGAGHRGIAWAFALCTLGEGLVELLFQYISRNVRSKGIDNSCGLYIRV